MATTNTNTITIRPAQRHDIPTIARLSNAANANSRLHQRIAPHQAHYPLSYHSWRLLIIRQRFVTGSVRNFVAEDRASKEILGVIALAVEGPQTALYRRWTAERGSWGDWLELKLIELEKRYEQYFTQRSVDYVFLQRFMAGFMADDGINGGDGASAAGVASSDGEDGGGAEKSTRPPCLHVHQIVVDPAVQSRGVGKQLIGYAEEMAVREDLPLFLESNLEATGFYDKNGFCRLTKELVVDGGQGEDDVFRIPVFVWEGPEEGRRGRWLERDGQRETWRWRDEMFH